MRTIGIWLSYDLSVNGDYDGLYRWLDEHKAIECGTSVAYFKFQYNEDLVSELRQQLVAAVEFSRKDRIYLISKQGTLFRGTFLIGKRKSSPWDGFGKSESTTYEDGE